MQPRQNGLSGTGIRNDAASLTKADGQDVKDEKAVTNCRGCAKRAGPRSAGTA